MANITAQEVNKLRQTTGSGMMDCKNALVEAEGDFEKAIDILRKKGQKVAAKRSDREANQGVVIAKTNTDNTFGVVILLSSETDFVAKNEEFVTFANNVADLALQHKPHDSATLLALPMEDGRTVNEHVTDLVGKIGEKIEVAAYEFIEAPIVAAYNHLGNKLATLVGLNKKVSEETYENAKNVAMQAAAMNPIALNKETVDEKILEREMEIALEQMKQDPKNANKPTEILEKIAQGKMDKFLKETTLLNQEYIKDSSITVAEYLKKSDKDLTAVDFKRVMIGA
ncbi:MAG: translation elongation factor Ts [Bacteroidales bacterium]|jgi:elongation factor Ts|nr:translation elongation factor Ts [Bacteroidales bacterium]